MNVYCAHPWEELSSGEKVCPVCRTRWNSKDSKHPPKVVIGTLDVGLTPAQIEAARRLLLPNGKIRNQVKA